MLDHTILKDAENQRKFFRLPKHLQAKVLSHLQPRPPEPTPDERFLDLIQCIRGGLFDGLTQQELDHLYAEDGHA